MGAKAEGVSGASIKDRWTKPKGGGLKVGKWGRLGWAGVGEGKMQTTVLERQQKRVVLGLQHH